MSLVNDMLNDLEARRGKEPAKPVDLDWMSGQGSIARKKSSHVVLIVALSALVIVAVFGSWLYLKAKQVAPVATSQPTAVSPSTMPLEVAAPATLDNIQWIRDGGVTVLKLRLSENKPYSLSRDEHLLRLRLFEVKSRATVDVLTPQPPVESVVMQMQDEDLVAIFSIKGDFSFSDRLSKTEANTIEIVLKSMAAQPEQNAIAMAPDRSSPKDPAGTSAVAPQASNKSKVVSSAPVTTQSAPTRSVPKSAQLTLSQRDLRLEKQARDLLRKGESYQAEKILQDFVEANSAAVRSAKLLISLWLSQNRFDPANDLIATTLGQYPEDVELRILRARSLLAEERVGDAVDWLMRQAPDMNTYPQYYELLGLAARRDQQYQLSEQAYRGLVATDPDRGDWLVGLAIALDAQARTTEARQAYQRALASAKLSGPLKQYAQQRLATN